MVFPFSSQELAEKRLGQWASTKGSLAPIIPPTNAPRPMPSLSVKEMGSLL